MALTEEEWKELDKKMLYFTAQKLYMEGLRVGEIEEIIKNAMVDLSTMFEERSGRKNKQ